MKYFSLIATAVSLSLLPDASALEGGSRGEWDRVYAGRAERKCQGWAWVCPCGRSNRLCNVRCDKCNTPMPVYKPPPNETFKDRLTKKLSSYPRPSKEARKREREEWKRKNERQS